MGLGLSGTCFFKYLVILQQSANFNRDKSRLRGQAIFFTSAYVIALQPVLPPLPDSAKGNGHGIKQVAKFHRDRVGQTHYCFCFQSLDKNEIWSFFRQHRWLAQDICYGQAQGFNNRFQNYLATLKQISKLKREKYRLRRQSSACEFHPLISVHDFALQLAFLNFLIRCSTGTIWTVVFFSTSLLDFTRILSSEET